MGGGVKQPSLFQVILMLLAAWSPFEKLWIRPIRNAHYGLGWESAVLTSSRMMLMLLVHRPLTGQHSLRGLLTLSPPWLCLFPFPEHTLHPQHYSQDAFVGYFLLLQNKESSNFSAAGRKQPRENYVRKPETHVWWVYHSLEWALSSGEGEAKMH